MQYLDVAGVEAVFQQLKTSISAHLLVHALGVPQAPFGAEVSRHGGTVCRDR